MHRNASLSRRIFIQTSAALMATTPLLARSTTAQAADSPLAGRLYKTLKIGMVNIPGTLTEKFKALKSVGFDGVEMDSPGMNVEETKKAIAESGLPVDGTVCSTHWGVRHTSPDAATRAKALEDLKTAIRATHAVGGHTVLLVVGKGEDGPEKEIWARSIENISKAIPLASELGVVIAIENVWNQFLYDHGGGADQKADKFVKYVDDLNSPWVGMQFDIGNHWKYGSMGDWIRQLGKRVVKLDVKGFSRKENKFTPIDQGDIDWLDVRKALNEINYYGWVAAEVGGGNADYLRGVAQAMDQVFALK
ncbi:MAG: sugar phosphate isomerase/epimerase family protein [Planctomycetota bacterium]